MFLEMLSTFMKSLLTISFIIFLTKAVAQDLTTVILVRHAEKITDGSKDPELAQAGKQRAEQLATHFSKTKIDAIYSTHFKRTEMTVTPLATLLKIPIHYYDGSKMEEVAAMLSNNKGGTIFIVGHSNTTPAIVNYLMGTSNEYKTFDDADYGNIAIVTLYDVGKQAKVIWLRY
jgi:2,3-bisphosphoglycerate-dependent phosphoglycerate mutase